MKQARVAIPLALCLCRVVAATASQVPDLPKVTVADLPAEVRDQVREAYDQALKGARAADASGKLGMLLDLYNRPDQAVLCYRRAHDLDPGAFKWLYFLGTLEAKRGQAVAAVKTLREALRLKPDYLPALLKLAEGQFDAGDLKASAQAYSGILKAHPDAAEACYGLGRIALAHGDSTAAGQCFRKACDLFPPYGAAHYQLAQIDRKSGKAEEADRQLAEYVKDRTLVPPVEDPLRDEMRALDRSAASLLQRGIELEAAGRLEEAISTHERALELDPGLMQAHVNLIILYGRAGDFRKAEEQYQAALKLGADKYPDAYYNYGVLMMKQDRLAEAEAAFSKAIEIKPAHAEALNDLGYLEERQGKLEDAATRYRKAIVAQPDFRKARFNLARILIHQRGYAEAIEQLRQTLTPVDEETPAYLYALGAAYGRSGDQADAVKYLEKAKDEAIAYRQDELTADIEKDLRSLGVKEESH
jgi:tetratricopeptide (TPR) repeat protein